MRKLIVALSSFILLFASCKEIGPQINFTNVKAVDTTYVVTPVPATDLHNALVEEFTGQACPNCPAAHNLLNSIVASDSGRVNVIGLYPFGSPQTVPPAGSVNDFRDSISNDIMNSFYTDFQGLPSAGIDRVPVAGMFTLFSSQWGSAINNRLNITDSLNLSLQSSYNTNSGVATITATITYTQPVSTFQNLSIVIVEDSITDLQEFPSGDENYLFTDVFRTMLTSAPFGDPILPTMTAKESGRVYRRTYTYTPKPNWVPQHCRVIAFVNYSNFEQNKDVFQSVQTKLTGL